MTLDFEPVGCLRCMAKIRLFLLTRYIPASRLAKNSSRSGTHLRHR
jgi:hypothetical protein